VGPARPPLALLVAVAAPPVLFVLSLAASERLRSFALGLDLRLVTMLQAWRVLGAVFLVLYAQGTLPGLFAWPAGLGDVAVGVAAPFVVLAMIKGRSGWQGRLLALNVGGLVDFLAAVGTGLLTSRTSLGVLAGEIDSGIMLELPLALIPTFLVPLFTILHVVSLLQLRQARRRA
jgi:hypothetical protein